jgi:hypothetical protein
MGMACSTNKGEEQCMLDFGGKARRKEGRPTSKWEEDNIKMDLRKMGWGDMDWIDLAQNRDQWRALVNTVMNLRVP